MTERAHRRDTSWRKFSAGRSGGATVAVTPPGQGNGPIYFFLLKGNYDLNYAPYRKENRRERT